MTTLNEKLRLGILPDELNFTASFFPDLDMDKVRYNTFYKSPEFWLHKFENPIAFLNLPASEKILESMIENSSTPLEEMLLRVPPPSDGIKEGTKSPPNGFTAENLFS